MIQAAWGWQETVYDQWLDPKPRTDLGVLLKPYPADHMEAFEVDSMVNNDRNDVPECIEPVDINPRLFL